MFILYLFLGGLINGIYYGIISKEQNKEVGAEIFLAVLFWPLLAGHLLTIQSEGEKK